MQTIINAIPITNLYNSVQNKIIDSTSPTKKPIIAPPYLLKNTLKFKTNKKLKNPKKKKSKNKKLKSLKQVLNKNF